MAPTKLSCPAGATCGYTTEEVEFEAARELLKMHRDIAHAAVDVNTVDEAVEADDGYIGEEVEFDTALELIKGHEHTAETVEDVNDEFLYMGLFGYTLEDARKRQHQQFKQGPVASTKLKCPASITTTEENVTVVKQKTGSKRAKRRRRIHDAKSRQHQRGGQVPALHLFQQGEEGLLQHQQGEEDSVQHQQGEVLIQHQRGEEVPDPQAAGGEVPQALAQQEVQVLGVAHNQVDYPAQHQWRDEVPAQHRRGGRGS